MSATFIGVRHHSPACARLVADTIERLRPAFVLVEGPADFNDRLDEMLLGHRLPIAIYTSYRDSERTHGSWSPFCDYSPEWVALTEGRRRGAQVRFIDLPAWHPAFAGRENRYADAERRYADVIDRLCRTFAVDNVDTLWDHLVEVEPIDGLVERLAAYFDLVRDGSASGSDNAREEYMAGWIRAALDAAGDRAVVVVTGGFHRGPLMRLAAQRPVGGSWPPTPQFPDGAIGGSYLVPFSFRRLDAFDGYQSGMPSPGYYQRVWEAGVETAAADLLETVVHRLRERGQVVSTADLIAGQAMAGGLARLRGHRHPARTDVLDGLVSALVTDALEIPPPWSGRGAMRAGADPVVVEMVAALSGDRVGMLHPDTPTPPLVPSALAELDRCGTGELTLELTEPEDLERSRTLHRLRVLEIPGIRRGFGPAAGAEPVLVERWTVSPSDLRLPALIEAGAYGTTLADAAAARLAEGALGTQDIEALGTLVFDAALCGLGDLSDAALERVAASIGSVTALGPLGTALATVLALWRHDRLFGVARDARLGAVIASAVVRVLWLVEGVHGGPAPADLGRLGALVATRDALRYAAGAVAIDREAALAVMRRVAADHTVPPDLRGAAFGFGWAFGQAADPVRATRGAGAPTTLGDWLAGLFALAREEVLAVEADGGVLGVLDELLRNMPERDFLVALPALRQAFAFFPPRERETVAGRLLTRRGLRGSARALLRVAAQPELIAEARELEVRVDELLVREGLASGGGA